jgi:phenylpropionate dioxygenase-like ring-hydroxylating dioxygenase large terminal subunit
MLANTDPALRRAWHVVARSTDVGVDPMQVKLLGDRWALVRLPAPGGGTRIAGFADRCPHRLAPLSAGRVVGDALQCAYHGWCFDGDGACTEIPALVGSDHIPGRARATVPAGIAERGGLVFLAPEEPRNELFDFAIVDDPRFLHGALEPAPARVGAGLMIDNFLDQAHFPFIHAATIGSDDALAVPELTIERVGYAMSVRSRQQFPNHEDRGVKEHVRPLLQTRVLDYEYRAPFAVRLRMDYVEAGGTNVIDFFVQPEDDDHCVLYTLLHRDDLDDAAQMDDCVAYETKILGEDLWIQEQYPDLRLPLDPTTEVHTRADRTGVELRRILADFVRADSGPAGAGSAEGDA